MPWRGSWSIRSLFIKVGTVYQINFLDKNCDAFLQSVESWRPFKQPNLSFCFMCYLQRRASRTSRYWAQQNWNAHEEQCRELWNGENNLKNRQSFWSNFLETWVLLSLMWRNKRKRYHLQPTVSRDSRDLNIRHLLTRKLKYNEHPNNTRHSNTENIWILEILQFRIQVDIAIRKPTRKSNGATSLHHF
jgi:hypothetical protein